MSSSLHRGRIGLALFAVVTLLPAAVRAKEYVSNRYGFQISIPSGFRERSAEVLNTIIGYVETDPVGGGSPITIDLRRTGTKYNPADKSALSTLPRQKGWTSSFETRRWKDMDLQVIRQEIAISSSESYVNYAIVFPLTGEGIIVVVQGKKSREKEVVKIFDDSIRQFVNLKPYVAVTGSKQSGEEHSAVQVFINVLLPVVTGAIFFFFIAKIRKSRAQAARQAAG